MSNLGRNVCGFIVRASLVFVFAAMVGIQVFAQSDTAGTIGVYGKVISIDPIKGDMTVRLEFDADASLTNEDGTLKKTIKLDTNSSGARNEVTFDKGKRMAPTEVVLSLFNEKERKEASVMDYPFDHHKAELILVFATKPEKKPKAEAGADGEQSQDKEEEEVEAEVPFSFNVADFAKDKSGTHMPGYEIDGVKTKDSDDSYLVLDMTITRSSMVKGFSVFVMLLMWGVSLAVIGMIGTVLIKGRKPEIAMFSFITALLFAFVAVRNSQPFVPPVGTWTDYRAFFPAIVILALCLLAVVAAWIVRPNGKQLS